MICGIRWLKDYKVAKETLEYSIGFGAMGKESGWWNESVESKVKVKIYCFKE